MVCSKYAVGPHTEQENIEEHSYAVHKWDLVVCVEKKIIYEHIAEEVKHKHKAPKCHKQSSNCHLYLNWQS